MGMSSREYYLTSYHDIMLKMEGFKNRLDHDENIMRHVAFYAFKGPQVDPKGQPKTVAKFWPMQNDIDKKADSIADKRARIKAALQKRKENGKA